MTRALYVTTAKGIQSYILGSDKLREMVGATSLVEGLTADGGYLLAVIRELGIERFQVVSAAAGAARVLFDSMEDARRLSACWPLIAQHIAPGLEIYQAVVEMERGYFEAYEAAEGVLAVQRQQPHPTLPEMGPLVRRNPRSGLAAVVERKKEGVLHDLTAHAKFLERERLGTQQHDMFADAYGYDSASVIPDSIEQLVGTERNYVAVVHADGNGLGQMFIDIRAEVDGWPSEQAIDLFRKLSQAIASATRSAVRESMRALHRGKPFDPQRVWPILPIVIAGDDLTLVCRGDLGIPFVERYLLEFERSSRRELSALQKQYQLESLPRHMSAGAGIAFVKAKYPFSRAYALCESLAVWAKSKAKAVGAPIAPSSLAFHRVTAASAADDLRELSGRELQGADGVSLVYGPYVVQDDATSYEAGDHSLPSLEGLRQAASAIRELPQGSIRELETWLRTDVERACRHYQRLRLVADQDAPQRKPGSALADALQHIGCHPDDPFTRSGDEAAASPIRDLLTLAFFEELGHAESQRWQGD